MSPTLMRQRHTRFRQQRHLYFWTQHWEPNDDEHVAESARGDTHFEPLQPPTAQLARERDIARDDEDDDELDALSERLP